MVQVPRLTSVNTRLHPTGRSGRGSDPCPGLPTVLKVTLTDSSLARGGGSPSLTGVPTVSLCAIAPPRHYASKGGAAPAAAATQGATRNVRECVRVRAQANENRTETKKPRNLRDPTERIQGTSIICILSHQKGKGRKGKEDDSSSLSPLLRL